MHASPALDRDHRTRRSPSFTATLTAHARLVARSGWVELVVFIAVTWMLCGWAASLVRDVAAHSYIDRQLGMHFVALVFAACWPLAVWRDEPPRQRAYLWSLPMGREQATFVRVLAGLGLLLVAVAVAHGGGYLIGSAIGRAAEFRGVSPLAWLAAGLGVAVVYLLASAIAVASNVPGRWILLLAGLVYAPPLMLPLPEALSFAFRPGPAWIYQGSLGFDRATRLAVTQAQLDAGLTEFAAGQWLPASLAWLAVGLALVWLAARRRIDV